METPTHSAVTAEVMENLLTMLELLSEALGREAPIPSEVQRVRGPLGDLPFLEVQWDHLGMQAALNSVAAQVVERLSNFLVTIKTGQHHQTSTKVRSED